MARVPCSVNYTTLVNDNDREIDGVIVTCSRCGQEQESFGQSEASMKRCFALLKEECPKGESNFYVADDSS